MHKCPTSIIHRSYRLQLIEFECILLLSSEFRTSLPVSLIALQATARSPSSHTPYNAFSFARVWTTCLLPVVDIRRSRKSVCKTPTGGRLFQRPARIRVGKNVFSCQRRVSTYCASQGTGVKPPQHPQHELLVWNPFGGWHAAHQHSVT